MLNLNENKNKLKVIISFIAIATLLVFIIPVLLINKEKGGKTTPVAPEKLIPPVEQTEKIDLETKSAKQKIIDSKISEINGDYLIASNDKYTITYIPSLEIFFVSIGKEPVADVKNEAQDFFKKFGLSQEDLCTLPVRFNIPNFEIKGRNKDFNYLPDGCS